MTKINEIEEMKQLWILWLTSLLNSSCCQKRKHEDHYQMKLPNSFIPDTMGCGKDSKLTLCQMTPNYPKHYMKHLLKTLDMEEKVVLFQNNRKMQFLEMDGFDGDIIDEKNKNPVSHNFFDDYKQSSDFMWIPLCNSYKYFILPTRGMNTDNKWRYIVNDDSDDALQQALGLVICVSPDAPCDVLHGFETQCRQHFIKHKLLALNETGHLVIDTFFIPQGCACFRASNTNIPLSKYEEADKNISNN